MNQMCDKRKLKREENRLRQNERNERKKLGPVAEANADVPPRGASQTALRFEPMDTWFFRESRPHNSVGSHELASLFPPPVRTLAGAVRTLVGETQGVDWDKFKNNSGHYLRNIIGYGDDLGPIKFDGPWLELNRERLYPAPAFLLARDTDDKREYKRFVIGEPVLSDLDRVLFPEVPEREKGFAALRNAWLTTRGLECVLAGETVNDSMIRECKQLYDEEPRLGIARNNRLRTAQDQMLYTTRHVRPKRELAVVLGVKDLDPVYLPTGPSIVRLGGEGRSAALSYFKASDPLLHLCPTPNNRTRGLILFLLTPADLDGEWIPPGFVVDNQNGVTRWRGCIEGVELFILSAALGKIQREGGWNQATSTPQPMRSLIPAGSAWYCTTIPDNADKKKDAIHKLHGARIGRDQQLGRGRLAVGLWQKSEFPKQETLK